MNPWEPEKLGKFNRFNVLCKTHPGERITSGSGLCKVFVFELSQRLQEQWPRSSRRRFTTQVPVPLIAVEQLALFKLF